MLFWILVADAARAMVFSTTGQHHSPRLEWETENPAGRARAQEIISDQPGRYSKGGKQGMLSALEFRTPVHKVEEQRFARKLARFLQKGLVRKQYESLVIFAPAQLLGFLRRDIGPEVGKHLFLSSPKDFTSLDARDLSERLPTMVWPTVSGDFQ